MAPLTIRSRTVDIEDDAEKLFEHFDREGWIDGHPVIPPTLERVERFLTYAQDKLGRSPEQVLAVLEPSTCEVTVEKAVINAIMAACRPEYLPVVFTAVEILAGWERRLLTGSHTLSWLLIINGPIAKALEIRCGEVGPYISWRANASIARAVRLIIRNIGGSPGMAPERRTFSQVAAYFYCLAENEDESPWGPYHVERGFSREDSTVTFLMCEPPRHMELGPWTYTTQELLGAFADSMSTTACRTAYGEHSPIVVFGPEHANAIAQAGFSKDDVKKFFYEHARTPLYKFGAQAATGFLAEWRKFYTYNPNVLVPMTSSPESFNIFVSGGPGPNSWFVAHQYPGVPIRRIEWPGE